MENVINRKEIAKGVYFSHITDSRYKKNRIAVNFFTALNKENSTVNAIIPWILTKNSEKLPTYKLLQNKLSKLYSSSISGVSGGLGDSQYIGLSSYSLDDMYALEGEKITAEITDMLIDCLFSPVLENGIFPEKTVTLEKQTVIDNIEAVLNDKRSYAISKATGILCKGEPAQYDACGTVEKANEITAQSAFDAYKTMLSTFPVEIVCVGCNDFSAAEKKLTEAFAKIERNNISAYSSAISPLKSEVETVVEELNVNQSKMVLGFKTSCNDLSAMVMMQKIYGGTTSSKLFMNVREKLSLCYYCSARYMDNKGLLMVDCGVENENIEKAKAEIIVQLEDMKNGNFTDEDIMFAQMSVQNDYNSISDSVYSVYSWYLMQIYKNTVQTPEKALESRLAATREGIISAAKSLTLDSVYILTSSEKEAQEDE